MWTIFIVFNWICKHAHLIVATVIQMAVLGLTLTVRQRILVEKFVRHTRQFYTVTHFIAGTQVFQVVLDVEDDHIVLAYLIGLFDFDDGRLGGLERIAAKRGRRFAPQVNFNRLAFGAWR